MVPPDEDLLITSRAISTDILDFRASCRQARRTGRYFGSPHPEYDVTADGRRFLLLETDAMAVRPEVILVQNWFEELRRLVPTP